MTQKIQQSGLASTEEAWDMVILPLSLHRKLLSPTAIVKKMRGRSRNLEQTGQWKQVLKIQTQVVEVCKEIEQEIREYYGTAAIVVDTYRRISSILDLQIQQFQRIKHLTQLQLVEKELKKMICEDIDARIVKALLGLYELQRPREPCPEHVWTRVGRFGKTFNNLSIEGHDADESLKDVAEAVQALPDEFTILPGKGLDMVPEKFSRFDWERESDHFPDPLGLRLAHYTMIRGVRNVGWALDLVAPNNDPVTSASDIAGWTSLHYASMSKDVQKTVMALWRHGGSVNAQSRDGTAPLHCLAKTGTRSEVTHLLDLGATPTVQDNSGYTPLHWAAWCGNVDAMEALLSKGADPGSRDNYGRTALHLATIAWKNGAVEFLSEKSDLGAKDVDGNTALHYAALFGKRTLASRGNYTEETGQGNKTRSPGETVYTVGDDALVTALFSGQKRTTKEDDKPSSASRPKESKENDNKPLPFEPHVLDSENVDGNAPIHVAIEHGHLSVVKRLLGAREQWRKSAYGVTPLRLAVMFGRPEVVKSLLGAQIRNDEPKPEDHAKPEVLFEMMDRLEKIKTSILNERVCPIADLRLAVLKSVHCVEMRADSPFTSPLVQRPWHRMQGKPQSSIESLQEAYDGGFRMRSLYREERYISEEYIKDLEEVRGILFERKSVKRGRSRSFVQSRFPANSCSND